MSSPPHSTPRRPGRPPAASRKGQSVRERLIDSATELSIEQGFDAFGLREISARAGVSSGMVAYYFGDRDGLHEAMFARALDRASEQMARIMADGQEGTDTLDAFIHMHVSLLAHDPWIPQFIAREVLACATPHRERFVEHVGAGPLTMLADWIEAAIERRELRSDLDPRLCALSIASMTALPFLILPIIGKEFGLTLDALTPEDLIEHNRSLLNFGLRAQTAGPK